MLCGVAVVVFAVPVQAQLGPEVGDPDAYGLAPDRATVEAYVPNPKAYYVSTTTSSGAEVNPISVPSCYWSQVNDSGLGSQGMVQQITATSSSSPDWAFIVTVDPSTCAGGIVADFVTIAWSGQLDVPTGAATVEGIALVCEVEQTVDSVTYTVPCPGTNQINPYLVRNDRDYTGQQVHGAYNGVVLTPLFVNGGTTAGPITVRIGWFTNATGGFVSVSNQNLLIGLGSGTGKTILKAPPESDRR